MSIIEGAKGLKDLARADVVYFVSMILGWPVICLHTQTTKAGQAEEEKGEAEGSHRGQIDVPH